MPATLQWFLDFLPVAVASGMLVVFLTVWILDRWSNWRENRWGRK